MTSFDTGYGAFDVSTIDPKVLKAAIEGVSVLAKTGIETAAAAAEAKRQKEAETKKQQEAAKKRKAEIAAAPAPVVAAPPPAPAVPGWAIALGALGTVAVVGAILYAPKAPPRRTA